MLLSTTIVAYKYKSLKTKCEFLFEVLECFLNIMAHSFGLFTPLECLLISFANDIQIQAVRVLQEETDGIL